MNWEEVSVEWARLESALKAKWGKLTDADLTALGDKRDLLVSALERHYGIQRKHAELQLDRWVSVLKPSGGASKSPGGGGSRVKA
jgi:uncharacterized protein YjbJ (UPF0337 family)